MKLPWGRLIIWWLLALLVAAGFAQAGRWQLSRMHEKQAILDDAAQALTRNNPQPLLLASDPKRATAYDWSEGNGRILNVTLWLDNQQRDGVVGVRMYCVLLPDLGGQALLVDAGWRPMGGDRVLPAFGCPARGDQHVRGLLAPPPAEGLQHGAAMAAAGPERWLAARMDMPSVAATLRLPMKLAPRVLRLDSQRRANDDGVMAAPNERELAILPNTLTPERHLGYAVQWFGLALTVLVVALVLTIRTLRE